MADRFSLPAAVAGGKEEELRLLRAAKQRCVARLAEMNYSIARLESLRDALRGEIAAFGSLLGEDDADETGQSDRAVANEHDSRSCGRREIARVVDAIAEILRPEGALHYRDIYYRISELGITVVGLDPAATLFWNSGWRGSAN